MAEMSSAGTGSTSDTLDEGEVSAYVVSVIDLLDQREPIRKLGRRPQTQEQHEAYKRLKDQSIGRTLRFRKMCKQRMSEETPGAIDRPAAETVIAETPWRIQSFSDTVVLFCTASVHEHRKTAESLLMHLRTCSKVMFE